MMHKDMQIIETAARTAMSGAYEPEQQESAVLRTGIYVTAGCIVIAAFILMLAWFLYIRCIFQAGSADGAVCLYMFALLAAFIVSVVG